VVKTSVAVPPGDLSPSCTDPEANGAFPFANRTNLCVDFAQGNYQSKGIFFGTTELFRLKC